MVACPPLARFAGYGLGMRRPHYDAFVAGTVPVDFVEVVSENFMVAGGRPLAVLDAVRGHYPVILHGVSMNLGQPDGLNPDYLDQLARLAARIEPLWISDHLCWTGIAGFNAHDLLPLPLTQESLAVVATNVARAQDRLRRPLVIENPSTYLSFAADSLGEAQFLAELAARTGCNLLLDINNVFVSATNHGFDAAAYLATLPLDRVVQVHLAGHSQGEHCLIDTHDAPVCDEVWALYRTARAALGAVAVMIERDDNIPPLPELIAELDRARAFAPVPA